MAIDRKARNPARNGLRMRFVRFSGKALTQGVVNMRIDGVPVRIYSATQTVADCLKYRKKIGAEAAIQALRESIRQNKCRCERLRDFARICRVERFVRPASSGRRAKACYSGTSLEIAELAADFIESV
jgi:hypothetical protein